MTRSVRDTEQKLFKGLMLTLAAAANPGVYERFTEFMRQEMFKYADQGDIFKKLIEEGDEQLARGVDELIQAMLVSRLGLYGGMLAAELLFSSSEKFFEIQPELNALMKDHEHKLESLLLPEELQEELGRRVSNPQPQN